MSKLIERIEQVGKSTPPPMGFGVSARQQPTPAFVVVASTAEEGKAASVQQGQADGVLFTPSELDIDSVANAAACLGDTPWGIRLQQSDQVTADALREKGCDFIAFLPNGVALDALQDEELGRLLVVTPDLDKEQGHILEDLPVDAALFSQSPPKKLSIETLLELAAHRNQIGKCFLLPVSGAPSAWELECLRNIGVEGLVLNLDQAESDALETLCQRVKELPKRKGRSDRPSAYIPQPSFAAAGRAGQEEEDGDDDDDGDF